MSEPISVNARAWSLLATLRDEAALLRVGVARGPAGEFLLDAGANHPGGIAAGIALARICLGGLGSVTVAPDAALPHWPWTISVASSQPVVACLASQYAGWSLAHGEKPNAFFALGSGPARALARKELLFAELDYADAADAAVLVLEAGRAPPAAVLEKVARDCGVVPERLGVAYAPTQSLAGGVQVVARVLDGMGAAPLPPPHPDFVTAMGRTNDAIIFGGRVHLYVAGPAAEARELAAALPAATSRDYGRPFTEIFRAAHGDFYAIDPMLFSPAQVMVTAVETGETFRAGALDCVLLDAAFS